MMGLPWRTISAGSIIFAYLTTTRKSEWTKLLFVGNFTASWAVGFLLWALWVVILYPKFFSPLRGLPEPPNNSLFMGQFSRIAAEPTGAPMMDWVNSVPNEGVIRYLGLFNQERILVTSHKALAEILVTKSYDFQKPRQFRWSIGRILGIGVLLAEGDEHRKQRRDLLPAFAFRHIKNLYPVFWDKAREGVQAMVEQVLLEAGKAPSGQESDNMAEKLREKTAAMEVGNWASRVTLDIIGLAGLGRDFGSIRDPENELSVLYQNLFKPSKQAQQLAMLGLVFPGWLLNLLPFKRNKTIESAAKTIRSACRDLIREKKEKLESNKLTDVDILSVALESGGFTEDNLVDQLMTFLAAGHETTASAMTWAIYMLCLHPDVQRRLRAEVRATLPPIDDASATVSSVDIDGMPYLNAVCNEVLRYYGPVPLTLREAARDTSILGHPVREGTRIVIAPWATNKSHELWGPDALEFNPERWMPRFEGDKTAASGGKTSPYAFMTFLHGPRSCIGERFARAEFACLLAAWVGKLSFKLKNEEELDEKNMLIKGGITARPAKGLYVHATVVDGW